MAIRIFRHYIPIALLALTIGEFLLFFAAVYLGDAARFGEFRATLHVPELGAVSVFPRALAYAIVIASALTAFGLYRADQRYDEEGYFIRFVGGFILGAVLLVMVFYAIPLLFIGRGVLAMALVISFLGSVLFRQIYFRAVGRHGFKRRVLIVGTGSRAAEIETLARDLRGQARFQIVGFVPENNEKPEVAYLHVIHEKSPLVALAHQYRADEIVVGVRDRRNGRLCMNELLECKIEGIGVTDISTFFERETGHLRVDSLNASWLVFSDGFHRDPARDVVKRIFDIAVSGTLVILTAPVMAVAALTVATESGRPIFFHQTRIGECGRPFRIWKFRSMQQNAEHDGVARWAQKNDSRVTFVGKIMRATRIDELPQLFNVLKGDMSFVGPRPERPEFIQSLEKQIPYYSSRHAVRPGITGWAQIRYPYGASVEDAMEKLQYDLYYVKNHTLFLDMLILFQTAQVVLFGKGAR